MFSKLTRLVALCSLLVLAACDSNDIDPGVDEIDVPDAYSFQSRFDQSAGSVTYTGQVVRNLLINDLKLQLDALGKSGATAVDESDLIRRYDYEDSYDLRTTTKAGTAPLVEDRYSAIATEKDLVGAVSNAALIGTGKNADAVVRDYLAKIAENSKDASKRGTPAVYTDENGIDMSQMSNKILLGAVAYSQATGKYLSIVLDQDNTAAASGKPYTTMEHYWDEAFGYFGAARDFNQYSDDDLGADRLWRDSNGDGKIDFHGEYVFAFARNAGKRDVGATGVDFTGTIFQAFLKGRTAIVNQASASVIAEQRDIIVKEWDRLIAATVIHYINDTIADMETVTQGQLSAKNNAKLNAHFAEAKGYLYALQFNPFKKITNSQLEELHAFLGNAPTYALPGSAEADFARGSLLGARNVLQAVYGFSDANVQNW